jgi:hypothetical protein
VPQLGQVEDVARGVVGHAGGQRSGLPVGALVALLVGGQLHLEHLGEQPGQPDGQAEQRRGDPGVGDAVRARRPCVRAARGRSRARAAPRRDLVEERVELRELGELDRVQQQAPVRGPDLHERGPTEVAVGVGALDVDADRPRRHRVERGRHLGTVVDEDDLAARGGGRRSLVGRASRRVRTVGSAARLPSALPSPAQRVRPGVTVEVRPTLLCVHPHPDDESIACGGVLARTAAHGGRTVVVTCTGGEAGENLAGIDLEGEDLPTHRRREMAAAVAALGVDEHLWLGYRDSGMVGTEDNEHADSFHRPTSTRRPHGWRPSCVGCGRTWWSPTTSTAPTATPTTSRRTRSPSGPSSSRPTRTPTSPASRGRSRSATSTPSPRAGCGRRTPACCRRGWPPRSVTPTSPRPTTSPSGRRTSC